MTLSSRSCVLMAMVVAPAAVLLTGCISTKPQSFSMSFLPSTPLPPDPILEEPPKLATHMYANESPELIRKGTLNPRALDVDVRIAKAEDRFEAGKKLYQQNDSVGARREFDAAMDILLTAPENLPARQRLERKLDQMAETIYRYDQEGLGSGKVQQQVVYDKAPLEDILDMTFPTDPKLRPKVKEEIDATCSQLPLQENDTVLGYIHYFSTERGHKTLLGGLRRAGRYRPLIQRILDEEGVPQELIYLAQVESGFLPRARSYMKAVGMWQFVQFRGREYGLNQTPFTDDRLDPEKSTRAAAKHLRDLYAMFGDWYLAMAAYNCGPGCVQSAVARTGYADFWDLTRLNALPKETANYVPLIVALTIMAKNPNDYELANMELDQPLEYDSIEVATPTSLALIADATDRPVSEIEDLNPALLKSVAPAGYQLRIPKGTSSPVLTALDIVPAARRASWRIHRVANGETLADIARRYSLTAGSITAANHRTDPPEAGDMLIIPTAAQPEHSLLSHGAVAQRARTTTHRRSPRKAVASNSTPTHTSVVRTAGKAPAVTYKTASLVTKHRSAAN